MSATSMFQQNIKMNKDDYPKLVMETDKFSTDVTTVASVVHGIENVLNSAYAPPVQFPQILTKLLYFTYRNISFTMYYAQMSKLT